MDSYPSQVVLVRFICLIYRALWLTRIKPVVIKQQTKKIYCLPARIGSKGWVLWTYTVVQVTNIKLPWNAGTLCAITTTDEDIRMVSFYCMDRTRGAKYVRMVQKRVKKGHEAYGQSCYTDWLDQKIPLGTARSQLRIEWSCYEGTLMGNKIVVLACATIECCYLLAKNGLFSEFFEWLQFVSRLRIQIKRNFFFFPK